MVKTLQSIRTSNLDLTTRPLVMAAPWVQLGASHSIRTGISGQLLVFWNKRGTRTTNLPVISDCGWRPGGLFVTMSEAAPQTVEQTEAALVTAAKAGQYDAFESLVNRYEHKIYRLGLNITGNPEDAEDVLQETFLKAFENLPRFREDSRFYTWIVRIAVNQALMKLRKRRTDRSVSLDDPIEEDGEVIPRDFADWKPNPEQLLGRTETRETLEKAIQDLPPSFRTVFMLRDVEGLSTEETAEMLGLSISAVKARLFRARLRLREELSKVFK
jgi:RNA polymerase sigma-70 factor, ECF subfamily